MQEAARNTERHRTSWSGTQLRHRAVNFVSAGDIESDETIDREPPGASEEPEDSELCPDLTADRETASDGLELPIDKPSESTAYTQQPKPDPQHCLPTPGDSSEDEIVFHGRGKPGKPQRHWRQMGSGLMPAPCDDSKDVEDRREELDCKHRDGQFISTIAATTLPTSDDAVPSLHSPPGRTVITDHSEDVDYISLNPVPPKQKTRRAHTEDENDAMEDYIANVDIDYEDMVNSFNPRGGPPVLYTLSPSSKSSNSAENDELGVSFGINSSLSTRGSALSVQDYYMENNQGLSGGKCKSK